MLQNIQGPDSPVLAQGVLQTQTYYSAVAGALYKAQLALGFLL